MKLLVTLAVGGALIAPSIAHALPEGKPNIYMANCLCTVPVPEIRGVYMDIWTTVEHCRLVGKIKPNTIEPAWPLPKLADPSPPPDAIWVPLPLNTAPTSNQSGKSR